MTNVGTIISMVVVLVIMSMMLIVMQSVTHSLVESIPESSAWNATREPTPAPTLSPATIPTQSPNTGETDWLGNVLIIAPFAAAGAVAFTYITRRRPNSRQTQQGIDGALDDSVRSNRRELEMTTLGDLAPSTLHTATECAQEPVVEKPGKSRWEQLE